MRVRSSQAHPAVRVFAAIFVAVATFGFGAPPANAGTHVTGGGSGFAGPEIDQWRADTAVNPYNLSINYVAQGSTFGRTSFSSNTLDFGASDIVYPPIEINNLRSSARCKGKALSDCFVYVPVSAGGVSFMYNLTDASGQRISNLRLTRREACKIFTGAITKWNDPELVATNPFLRAFAFNVVPVIRSDGAGESYVLSQFCLAVAPDVWSNFIAKIKQEDPLNVAPDFAAGEPVSNWPSFKGSTSIAFADGVANAVADSSGRGAVTYVAASYAKQRSFPTASLQNAAGVYTQPDEANVTVALGYARKNPSGDAAGTFILNFNGGDPRAYFPSTYSYILVQRQGGDLGQGATMGLFLCYAISAGQQDAVPLRYARLSAPIVAIAEDAITKIPGAPEVNHCLIGPPPPSSLTNDLNTGGGGGVTGATTPGALNGGSTGNTTSNALTSSGGTNNGNTSTNASGSKSAKGSGKSGAVASDNSSETTPSTIDPAVAQQRLDNELAAAAHGTPESHASVPGIWILLAGVIAAWLLTMLVRRRKAKA
jgi:ABC-type phosphate transport system substrate-binding protein